MPGEWRGPAVWLMISSVLVRVYKNLGFWSKVKSTMTLVLLSITVVLLVDDTDLYIISYIIRR